jgi:hypothetical protein
MSSQDFHNTTGNGFHDALNRMKRAYARGTGCRLTAEMLDGLGISIIGQMWEEEDPRGINDKDPHNG